MSRFWIPASDEKWNWSFCTSSSSFCTVYRSPYMWASIMKSIKYAEFAFENWLKASARALWTENRLTVIRSPHIRMRAQLLDVWVSARTYVCRPAEWHREIDCWAPEIKFRSLLDISFQRRKKNYKVNGRLPVTGFRCGREIIRTENIPVGIWRMLCQLVGLGSIEHLIIKFDVFGFFWRQIENTVD